MEIECSIINPIELKKKLRKLKKLEIKIRYDNINIEARKENLVWDIFFCTKNYNSLDVKYNFNTLLNMTKNEFKYVIDEYFLHVYYQNNWHNGLTMTGTYDPRLLQILKLPLDADLYAIKKRFKELAKIYHPDRGGDKNKMIELLDIYNKLTEK